MSAITRARVVHMSSAHPASDTRMFHKECRALAEAGYDVTLVVPHDSSQTLESVHIEAVPMPRSRWERMFATTWRVYRVARKANACVYHLHDPELIPAGWLLKLAGKRVVYDVHEDLPRQIQAKDWIPRLLRGPAGLLAELVEGIGARSFDGVVAATPIIARRFPQRKTITVHNFVETSMAVAGQQAYRKRPPYIAYVGGMFRIRGTRELVQSMSLVPATLGARLVLVGEFKSAEFQKELEELPGWSSVDYRGFLDHGAVSAVLSQARIGIHVPRDTPNNRTGYNTKFFEYMASALPIVASDFPLWRQLWGDIGCFLFVDSTNPADIAGAVSWLLTHPAEAEEMGRLGHEAVAKRFSWEREERRLLSLYEHLCGTKERLSC